MHSLEAFLAVVIVCIDNNKRRIENFLGSKHGLTGSPRFRAAFRQSARNIINILECIIHCYIMGRADGSNTLTDNFFKLLLDILADDKYHMVEACFNGIMDRIIHDDVSSIIHRFQLLDSCSEATADTSCHYK